MALRLRRGTDAERQLITPLEGELIYTTDTKILFIGDGVTQGGLQVTGVFPESIDDLTDVDISNIAPTVGQVLIWNGEQFVPADIIGPDGQINADIIADDSTLLVDSETQAFQGISFVGQNFIGGTFTGSFIGDGSQLTNLPIATDGSGIIEGSNYRINIAADDSTIMVDTNTQTFTGNFIGDLQGNVISDDSTTVMVDILNDRLSTTLMDIENYSISINSEDHGLAILGQQINFFSDQLDGNINTSALITIQGNKYINDTVVELTEGEYIGGLALQTLSNGDQSATKSAILSSIDTVTGASNTPAKTELWLEDSEGNFSPMFNVNSRGVAESAGPFKMPRYANDADRDTKIPNPEEGMVIFNQRDDSTGVPQFQGYDGTTWVDLH